MPQLTGNEVLTAVRRDSASEIRLGVSDRASAVAEAMRRGLLG